MKRFLKIAAVLVAVLVFVLVGGFLYATSSGFITGTILPRAGEAAGVPVAAETVKLSVLKRLEVTDLTVGEKGDPIVKIGTVRCRYRLLALLDNEVQVDEVLIKDVAVNLTDEKLALLQKAGSTGADTEAAPPSSSSKDAGDLPRLAVKKIGIENLSLVYTGKSPNGETTRAECLASVTIPELATGQPFTVTLNADASVKNKQLDGRIGTILTTIAGKLGSDLMPASVEVKTALKDVSGTAGELKLDGHSLEFYTDVQRDGDAFQLKTLRLAEFHNTREQGSIQATGAVTPAPLSARIDVSAALPDGAVLNLLGAMLGDYDFGRTAIHYNGHVDLTNEGQSIAASGDVNVSGLTVASTALKLDPIAPLTVKAAYDISADMVNGNVNISTLDVNVTAPDSNVANIRLDKPINVILNTEKGTAQAPPATLTIRTDGLDLALLKPLIPPQEGFEFLGGRLEDAIDVVVAESGQQIRVTGHTELKDLRLKAAGEEFAGLGIRKDFDLALTGLKKLSLNKVTTSITEKADAGLPRHLVDVVVDGGIDLEQLSGTIHLRTEPITDAGFAFANRFIGDLDYGKTNATYDLTVDLGANLDEIRARGKLAVADMTVSSTSLDIPALAPLQIAADHSIRVTGGGKAVVLETCELVVRDPTAEIVTARLLKPSEIDLSQAEPTSGAIPVALKIDKLKLAQFKPFLASTAGIETLQGVLSVDSSLEILDLGKGLRGTEKLQLKGLSFTMRDVGELKPIDITVETAMGMTADQMVALNTGRLTISRDDTSLAAMDLTGAVDAAMKGRKSELKLVSQSPIDLGALEACFVPAETSASSKTPEIPAEPVPTEEAAATPGIWAVATTNLAELRYRDITIKDLKATAEFKDNRLEVRDTSLGLNEGSVSLAALLDLSDSAQPAYDASLNLTGISITPFMSSFVSDPPVDVTGGVKQLAMTVKGKGSEWERMREALSVKTNFELDQITFGRFKGWLALLVEQVLLRNLDLAWEDLNFVGGTGEMELAKGILQIPQLELLGQDLRLATSGTVDGNNDWLPDLQVVPAFSGSLATRLAKHHIPLTATEKKDQAAPTIPIKGEVWKTTNISRLAVDYGVALGKVDARAKYASDGVGALKDLGKTMRDKDKTAGEKLGNAAQSIFGIIQNVESARKEQKQREKAEDEKPAAEDNAPKTDAEPAQETEKPKSNKDEAVNQLIKSIFR